MEKVVKEVRLSIVAFVFKIIIDIIMMAVFIGFVWFIKDIIKFINTKLIITTNYIKGQTGLVKTENLNSPLNKITGIQVKQGLFGKIFNYGTLSVLTPSTIFHFEYVDKPYDIQTIINNQIIGSEDERIDKQANKIADAMGNRTEKIVDAINKKS